MMNGKRAGKTEDLREHYAADAGAELAEAADGDEVAWETDTDPDPMIGISLRLPRSTMDAVRELARRQKVKPTALIRAWVEQALAADTGDLDVTSGSLALLARVVRESVHAELVDAKLVGAKIVA